MNPSNNRRDRRYHPYGDASNRRDNNRAQNGRGRQHHSDERDFSPPPDQSPRKIGALPVVKMELRAFKNKQGILVSLDAVNRSLGGGPQTRIRTADPTAIGAVMVKTNIDNDVAHACKDVRECTGASEIVACIYPCNARINAELRRTTGTPPPSFQPHAIATASAAPTESDTGPTDNPSTNISNIFQQLADLAKEFSFTADTDLYGLARDAVPLLLSPEVKRGLNHFKSYADVNVWYCLRTFLREWRFTSTAPSSQNGTGIMVRLTDECQLELGRAGDTTVGIN
ncbi:hypothetical protein BGZ63DRAFT_434616 [Mariannaea sp. PMI_226]|nr:hypothetical protein BGZ63DRAFT_434616 [Mariannaea sp. PMI_226]